MIKITYFRESGKYYTHWSQRQDVYRDSSTQKLVEDLNMKYYDAIKIIQNTNIFGQLPGLAYGRWGGPILVELDYPVLVLNPNNELSD